MKHIVEYGWGVFKPTIQDLRKYLDSNPHPKSRLVSVDSTEDDYLLVWETEDENAEHNYKILLNAAKMAWRKHALDDKNIGWEKLTETLSGTLAQVMGDKAFDEWSESIDPESIDVKDRR